MEKTIYRYLFLMFIIAFPFSSAYAQLMGDLFPTGGSNDKSGPTEITSNSMDINLERNIITLYGNVVVNDKETNITADKIVVFLTDVKTEGTKKNKEGQIESESKKEAKKLIATGNVIIIKKPKSNDTENAVEEKATANKANYNVKTGVIVLTEDPILFQGGSYIRGEKITMFRDSNRVIVEGNQYVGQSSKLIYNPSPPPPKKNEEDTDKSNQYVDQSRKLVYNPSQKNEEDTDNIDSENTQNTDNVQNNTQE